MSEMVYLPRLLADTFAISTSEGRRLLNQGAVGIDDRQVVDFELPREMVDGKTLRVGRRRSAEIKLDDGKGRGLMTDRARARELTAVARTLLREASRATEDDYETVRENFATAVVATTDALDALDGAIQADVREWAA